MIGTTVDSLSMQCFFVVAVDARPNVSKAMAKSSSQPRKFSLPVKASNQIDRSPNLCINDYRARSYLI